MQPTGEPVLMFGVRRPPAADPGRWAGARGLRPAAPAQRGGGPGAPQAGAARAAQPAAGAAAPLGGWNSGYQANRITDPASMAPIATLNILTARSV